MGLIVKAVWSVHEPRCEQSQWLKCYKHWPMQRNQQPLIALCRTWVYSSGAFSQREHLSNAVIQVLSDDFKAASTSLK
jgi:hypothetical protein